MRHWLLLILLSGCIAIPVPRDGTNGVGVAQTPPPAGQIHRQYVGLDDIPPKAGTPVVAGKVLLSENSLRFPLKFVRVQLQTEAGKTLFQTTTDTDGRYRFQEKLKTGRYRVVVVSEKFEGQESVSMGNGQVGNIDVSAKRLTGQ